MTHSWREVHEQGILGGSFRVGWECIYCDTFIPIGEIELGIRMIIIRALSSEENIKINGRSPSIIREIVSK